MRESPALDVMGLLHAKRRAGVVLSTRTCLKSHGREWSRALRHQGGRRQARGTFGKYDCIVIITDHKSFDYDAMVGGSRSRSSTPATRSRCRGRTCSGSARRAPRVIRRWRSSVTFTAETEEAGGSRARWYRGWRAADDRRRAGAARRSGAPSPSAPPSPGSTAVSRRPWKIRRQRQRGVERVVAACVLE